MIEIYTIPVSLYCAKLRTFLRHKELKWQEIPPPGGYGSSNYKKIIPSGNLPALIADDFYLSDSEVIAEYLNETHSQKPMLPTDAKARAKAREKSRHHDTRLEPSVRATFGFLPNKELSDEQSELFAAAINARLAQLANLLGDETHLDAGDLHLGDCGFPITFAWIHSIEHALGLKIIWPSTVLDYKNKLKKVPAVVAELADYEPKLIAFFTKE
jgi:glutathione S-transferase